MWLEDPNEHVAVLHFYHSAAVASDGGRPVQIMAGADCSQGAHQHGRGLCPVVGLDLSWQIEEAVANSLGDCFAPS